MRNTSGCQETIWPIVNRQTLLIVARSSVYHTSPSFSLEVYYCSSIVVRPFMRKDWLLAVTRQGTHTKQNKKRNFDTSDCALGSYSENPMSRPTSSPGTLPPYPRILISLAFETESILLNALTQSWSSQKITQPPPILAHLINIPYIYIIASHSWVSTKPNPPFCS